MTFEWKAGAIFAIPLNTWHQHFNGSGKERGALRLVDEHAADHQPLRRRSTSSSTPPHDFQDRFNGEPDYFANKGEQKGLLLETNFVADAVNLPLIAAKERGAGGGHIRFIMAKGSMNSHISQFPVGTYKKGHRHGPGAHVIIMSGEGFSLMWPEGEEPRRYEWKQGTLIVPPNMWFHQHFNTGTDAGALPRLQARGGRHPQRPGRAEGLDQPAHRRRPDRLRRRVAGGARDLRRGARRERPRTDDGRGLRSRAGRPAAQAVRTACHRPHELTTRITTTPEAGEHDDELMSRSRRTRIWQQDNVTLHSVGVDIG